MEFSVLGPLEVRADGRAIPLGGTQKRALLAALLLNANRPIGIERLVDALWGETPPATATTTVHVYISQLRKALGRERLTTSPAGYVLEVGSDELDRARFEQLVAGARLATDPAETAALLREALALWRGPALEDLRFEPVTELEARRLDEERSTAIEELIDAELQLGFHERVIPELEQLIVAHPLRERLHQQLMLALYRCGRQADALAAYRNAAHMLRQELGIEPGPDLRRLEKSILNQDPALGAGTPLAARAQQRDEHLEPREERKIVTVLFADIAGFTRRAEELDPEDVRRLLRRFHEPIRRELERFGGTVEKFIGDAVMAVFGAPVGHEDDAERAVRAAFAVRNAVHAASAEEAGLDLDLRIGINSGEVLAVIDADVRSGEGLVAGDVVNTAARLQAAAPVNSILVGEATRRATESAIGYRRFGPVTAKGKVTPVSAWEATEALVPVVQADRNAGGPLVGRARERRLLADAFARVQQNGHVEMITVVGVPGIGKSRLVSEFGSCGAAPTPLVGRCLSYGGVPYVALSQIVKASARIAEGDVAAAAAAKLADAVPDELPEARWIRRHLRLLIGLDTDARGERRELFAAWRRFLEEQSSPGGAVLVFEDIHWADDDLLDFIDSLVDRGRGRMLVLCTARPELLDRRPDWRGTLTLPPLSDDETGHLLKALLGDRALPDGLLSRIGGNPLFAQEFARSLERGDDLLVPESIQATIAARLDLLPPPEKRVLHAAAVLGRAFAAEAVATIDQSDLPSVSAALEFLERLALVRRERETDHYAFAHVLIRDVAYGQVPRARRAIHHRLAAEWLEERGERSDERVDAVAYHYANALEFSAAARLDTGDLPQRALASLARAGERALRLHAYRQALQYFERARALGGEGHVDEGLGRALQTLGRSGEARLAFERALSVAPEPAVAARLNRLIAAGYTSEYRHDEADAAFDRAEAALELLQPGAERAREWLDVQIARLTLLYWRQDIDRMDALIERARPVIERDGERRQRAEFLASEYMARIVRERYRASDETLEISRRFLAARQELGDPVDIARARFNVGFVHVTRGELLEAESELAQALGIAERTGDATLRSRSLTYLAQVHRRRRDVDGARSFAERALAAATELRMPEYVGAARATLGWVAWMEDDRARATTEADAALEAFGDAAFAYPWEWTARLPLLAIALDDGRIADAVVQARAIVDVRQQPLSEELEDALGRAVCERDLRSALAVAVAQGFA